jgi:hypothetical protein
MAFTSFYQPGKYNWENGQGSPWTDTELGNWMFEDQPESSYQWTGARRNPNYAGVGQQGDLFRSIYGRVRGGYETSRLDRPELSWRQFLDDYDWEGTFQGMSPQARGENQRQFVGGNRWLTRDR